MSNKREQVKKLHPYALTPPKTENGRWQTCYKDEKGNRKNIKAQTQEEWLEYRKICTESPNTILRHKQHYRKYLDECMQKLMTLYF